MTLARLLDTTPPPAAMTGGVVGGVPGGLPGGQLNRVIGGIIGSTSSLAAAPHLVKGAHRATWARFADAHGLIGGATPGRRAFFHGLQVSLLTGTRNREITIDSS